MPFWTGSFWLNWADRGDRRWSRVNSRQGKQYHGETGISETNPQGQPSK